MKKRDITGNNELVMPLSGNYVKLLIRLVSSARKKRKLSRSKLAEMAGVHPNSIVKLERERVASAEMLFVLCNALGFNPILVIARNIRDKELRWN